MAIKFTDDARTAFSTLADARVRAAAATADITDATAALRKEGFANVVDLALAMLRDSGFGVMTNDSWASQEIDDITWDAWRILVPLGGRGKDTVGKVAAIATSGHVPTTTKAWDETYAALEAVRILPAKEGGGLTAAKKVLKSGGGASGLRKIVADSKTDDKAAKVEPLKAYKAAVDRLRKEYEALPAELRDEARTLGLAVFS